MNNTIIALLVCTAFLVLGFALGYGLRSVRQEPLPDPAPIQVNDLVYRTHNGTEAGLRFTF